MNVLSLQSFFQLQQITLVHQIASIVFTKIPIVKGFYYQTIICYHFSKIIALIVWIQCIGEPLKIASFTLICKKHET